jgi:histidinol-phosphate aminotransferase
MIQPKKSVKNMKPYDPPLEYRKNYLRLDFNENTIGCSPKVIDALKKVTPEIIAMYQ